MRCNPDVLEEPGTPYLSPVLPPTPIDQRIGLKEGSYHSPPWLSGHGLSSRRTCPLIPDSPPVLHLSPDKCEATGVP